MARASAIGHRVVLVIATKGEQGEVEPGLLRPDETLSERRVAEVIESAQILGIETPIFLGYEDSGMVGEPANENPKCFWQADVALAAQQLAAILKDVDVDVLTIYDDHGLYGHPDHIQVHRVGLAAARLLDLKHVYEATISRSDAMENMEDIRAQAGSDGDLPPDVPEPDEFSDFGMLAEDIAYKVDVTEHLEKKRAALRAHRTQVSEQSFFLGMSDQQFRVMFGQEWFAVPGGSPSTEPQQLAMLPGL